MCRRVGGRCRSGAGLIGRREHSGAVDTHIASPSSSEPQPLVGSGLPRSQDDLQHEKWMWRALEVAKSTPRGDVPVGAVVYGPDGRELAVGVNQREKDGDPLGHAEIAAIHRAVAELGDAWRLEECTLVVTLEPCAMCAGAALGARIKRIVYGAREPKTGACGSVWDLPRESPLHKAEVYGGVLRKECEVLLKSFFKGLR